MIEEGEFVRPQGHSSSPELKRIHPTLNIGKLTIANEALTVKSKINSEEEGTTEQNKEDYPTNEKAMVSTDEIVTDSLKSKSFELFKKPLVESPRR